MLAFDATNFRLVPTFKPVNKLVVEKIVLVCWWSRTYDVQLINVQQLNERRKGEKGEATTKVRMNYLD